MPFEPVDFGRILRAGRPAVFLTGPFLPPPTSRFLLRLLSHFGRGRCRALPILQDFLKVWIRRGRDSAGRSLLGEIFERYDQFTRRLKPVFGALGHQLADDGLYLDRDIGLYDSHQPGLTGLMHHELL